jgi:hypothetical protein
MCDPTLARIVIDSSMPPGTTSYSSRDGVWRVHSEREARRVSEDRRRWVWQGQKNTDTNAS